MTLASETIRAISPTMNPNASFHLEHERVYLCLYFSCLINDHEASLQRAQAFCFMFASFLSLRSAN